MEKELAKRLTDDLQKSLQVKVFGPKVSENIFKGSWEAPKSRGWTVACDPDARTIWASKEGEESRIRFIEETGQIWIWTNADGPNIFWTRDAENKWQRSGHHDGNEFQRLTGLIRSIRRV